MHVYNIHHFIENKSISPILCNQFQYKYNRKSKKKLYLRLTLLYSILFQFFTFATTYICENKESFFLKKKHDLETPTTSNFYINKAD